MKKTVIHIFAFISISAFAQYGPDGRYHKDTASLAADAAADARATAQAQAATMQAIDNQWAYQHQLTLTQQAEQQAQAEKIYSKDPWRNINGATNQAKGAGWVQFQGIVQETISTGVIFKGRWGQILTISTDLDYNEHLIVKNDANAVKQRNGNSTSFQASQVQDAAFARPKVYGDDLFFVDNFPYPATFGTGYEEMLALDGDYYSYTNSNGQTITIHKMIYGRPCQKVWSPQEIADAQQKINAPQFAALHKSFQTISTMATNGDAGSQYNLGIRYLKGMGCETNQEMAVYWIKKSAAQGYLDASNKLISLNEK